MIIIQDSREQKPYTFKRVGNVEDIKICKLDVGDYSIRGYEHLIAYERKNPQDLHQTLTAGMPRFKKEIERAKNHEHFSIIVECSYTQFITGKFQGKKYSKVPTHVTIKTLHTIKHKYGVNIVFCNDRKEAQTYVRNDLERYYLLKQKQQGEETE